MIFRTAVFLVLVLVFFGGVGAVAQFQLLFIYISCFNMFVIEKNANYGTRYVVCRLDELAHFSQ